jgi:hypothetical protein
MPEVVTATGRTLKACVDCRTKRAQLQQAHRDRTGDNGRAYQRNIKQARRRKVIDHYGGKCLCCGETQWQFLAIDHKDGGGNIHRKEVAQRGNSMVGWIIANEYPDLFEIRCHNCNQARGFYGVCPHERQG